MHTLKTILITLAVTTASLFGFVPQNQVTLLNNRVNSLEQKIAEDSSLLVQEHQQLSLGAFNPTGGGTYRLKSSVGISDVIINLASFKEPSSNLNYSMTYLNSSIAYGTIDPQTTRSEFVSFTGITQNSDGSAQLTGVTRGLTRTPAGSACTASTTLAQRHSGQSAFVLSDSPCFFAEYATKKNDEAITGLWRFNSYLPTTSITPTTSTQFAPKGYVDSLVFSGASVIDATAAARGIVELATTLEGASSTPTGTSGVLALPATSATSTYNATTAPLRVVVTQNSGKIDQNFFPSTSTAQYQFASTTMIGFNRAQEIGMRIQTFTATGTATFIVPSGVTKVRVRLVGGGGGGEGGDTGVGASGGGSGGGSEKFVDVSATSSIQVTVGGGGGPGASGNVAGGTGSPTYFGPANNAFLSATGGIGGTSSTAPAGGGLGGIGSGGDINIRGGPGGTSATAGGGREGGSSMLGGGAAGTGVAGVGNTGGVYGGGGGGGFGANAGGAGAPGIIIVTY